MTTAAPRLLYIDDDDGLRRLFERAMTRRGYVVTLAASGEEGISVAATVQFDAIALDHYMPGLDGLGTLTRLRDTPDAAPVVYVTGSEETKVAVAALKAGAADYVVKTIGDPFFELLDTAITGAVASVTLRREKDAADAALKASNARLEILLREVNHRVANSLQLVSAFVHMQAAGQTDPALRATLEQTQSRITAIAQVHRRLYTAGHVESVEMRDFLEELAKELGQGWCSIRADRRVTVEADILHLSTDQAVSVGVIVNELVTNACKYAYDEDQGGEVRIGLKRHAGNEAVLSVEDDGQGFDPAGPAVGTGLGRRLIVAMAKSLGGEVQFDTQGKGVRVSLHLPLPEPA